MAISVSYIHIEKGGGVGLETGVAPGSFRITEGFPPTSLATVFVDEKYDDCVKAAVEAFNKAFRDELDRKFIQPLIGQSEAAE